MTTEEHKAKALEAKAAKQAAHERREKARVELEAAERAADRTEKAFYAAEAALARAAWDEFKANPVVIAADKAAIEAKAATDAAYCQAIWEAAERRENLMRIG